MKTLNSLALISLIGLTTSGCATIIEGKTQAISVSTVPPGADCNLSRAGYSLGHVNPSPGALTVEKTKHDIEITCSKAGYVDASLVNHSDFAAWALGNILIGGIIGAVVDASSGANNKYDSQVTLTLTPLASSSKSETPAAAKVSEASHGS